MYSFIIPENNNYAKGITKSIIREKDLAGRGI